jgi:anaerobic magnesium-protoporphyrin IX monomethyl ester cyclase
VIHSSYLRERTPFFNSINPFNSFDEALMNLYLLNPTVDTRDPVLRSERCQAIAKKGVALWPPIALAYIASVLRNAGFSQLSFRDAMREGDSLKEMIQKILAKQPDLVIVQSTTPTVRSDLKMVQAVKQQNPHIRFAFFGVHPTVEGVSLVESGVDFALQGEPEDTLVELAQHFSEPAYWKNILGLYFKEGEEVRFTGTRTSISSLDRLPFPARDLFDPESYRLPDTNAPFTLIKISRGCPYLCTFCTVQSYYGATLRHRSPANIVAEIQEVIESSSIRDFLFHSDTFNMYPKLVEELCERLQALPTPIRWVANSRVDLLSPALLRQMKAGGCTLLSLGVESGDPEILKKAKKGITPEQALQAVRWIREAGIRSLAYFILGLPGETPASLERTIQFAKELDPDYAQFFTATPFPGTTFHQMLREQGWSPDSTFDGYFNNAHEGIVDLEHVSKEEISRALKRAHRQFYFRPRKILRELRETINHPKVFLRKLKLFTELVR